MKKQKIKLGLKKINISNLQNSYSIQGGQGSVQLCTDGNCDPTVTCNTQQGGYVCGLTLATECTINWSIYFDCFTIVCDPPQ